MDHTQLRLGILGIGTYLPEQVRRNDWWPADIVESWSRRSSSDDPAGIPAEGLARDAILSLLHDPFHGAVERRVMADDMTAADMEVLAGRRALEAAGISPGDVELCLVSSWVPDLIGTNTAATVHAALGLSAESVAFGLDSNFNGFHHQIAMAEAMLLSGRARYGLLLQSASVSRLMPRQAVFSPWFGDGATAVVVGLVAGGFGLLASSHQTDGALQEALLTGVPGKRWFDEGRSYLYSARPERQRMVLAQVTAWSSGVIHRALANAGLTTADVDFFACHQGTAWYRRVMQEAAGLEGVKTLDTFPMAASIAACNVPLVMSVALERGLLAPGDVVATHAGGNGATWSSLILRWGSPTC